MAIGVIPAASATRRMLTAPAPSRSNSARAAARMRSAVRARVMYTAYTKRPEERKDRKSAGQERERIRVHLAPLWPSPGGESDAGVAPTPRTRSEAPGASGTRHELPGNGSAA